MAARSWAEDLVVWGQGSLRDLPWRRTRDPWAVLVAETMLQQTQVSRVVARWAAFLERFPSPPVMAAAPAADVVRAWAGLGYNRRALNLHRASVVVTQQYGGGVPVELDALVALPGVGPYTARAVRAFAFEVPAAPVDTNIGRVLARVGGRSLSRAEAQQMADRLAASSPAGVWLWNQSLMELGALVCTKRQPLCGDCPVAAGCSWRGGVGLVDPATGSAATARPQGPFRGSDREMRGRVVDALRGGPLVDSELRDLLPGPAARRGAVIDRLVADGLVERRGEWLALPGEAPGQSAVGPVSERMSSSTA